MNAGLEYVSKVNQAWKQRVLAESWSMSGFLRGLWVACCGFGERTSERNSRPVCHAEEVERCLPR